jgi:tetratricopeptide (TPR) repeat protein
MAADLILACFLALAGDGPRTTGDRLKEKEDLLAGLYELQRRVRAGELPAEEELALGGATRERVLGGLDVAAAHRLGFDPAKVKNLLLPGFAAEIDALARSLQAHDLSATADVSPLLTLVLEVEQQLFAAADRRRQRAGLKSPIDATALSRPLEAPGEKPVDPTPTTAPAAGAKEAAPTDVAAAVRATDPRVVGKTLYRAGRYDDALAAWTQVNFDAPDLPLELVYMHADALFRGGRAEDAIKEWERLASGHADSSFGQQASFALNFARAMVALKAAGGETTPAPVKTASNAPAKAPAKAPAGGGGEKKDGGRHEP